MMNTIEVLAAIDEVMEEFTVTYAEFDDYEVNEVPFEGSWTPGQLAQHVIMSLSGLADLLAGPDAETTRAVDTHVENLKAIFLNYDIKMQSPPSIEPPEMDYDQQEQIDTLEELEERLNGIISQADMSCTCTASEFPTLGYLTRTELAHFIVYHTTRHVHQLKNILTSINSL